MLAGPKTVLFAAHAQNRGAHATTPRRRDARGALLGQPDHLSAGGRLAGGAELVAPKVRRQAGLTAFEYRT